MNFVVLFFLLSNQTFSQKISNTKYKRDRKARKAMLTAHFTRKLPLYYDSYYRGSGVNSSYY